MRIFIHETKLYVQLYITTFKNPYVKLS